MSNYQHARAGRAAPTIQRRLETLPRRKCKTIAFDRHMRSRYLDDRTPKHTGWPRGHNGRTPSAHALAARFQNRAPKRMRWQRGVIKRPNARAGHVATKIDALSLVHIHVRLRHATHERASSTMVAADAAVDAAYEQLAIDNEAMGKIKSRVVHHFATASSRRKVRVATQTRPIRSLLLTAATRRSQMKPVNHVYRHDWWRC